jgi:hypothetical protein
MKLTISLLEIITQNKELSLNTDMDMVFSSGLMELTTRVTGGTIKLRVKALSGMLRGMSIEENSKMIWLTDMESTLILMGRSTKGSSEMTFKRVMGRKSGLTVPST